MGINKKWLVISAALVAFIAFILFGNAMNEMNQKESYDNEMQQYVKKYEGALNEFTHLLKESLDFPSVKTDEGWRREIGFTMSNMSFAAREMNELKVVEGRGDQAGYANRVYDNTKAFEKTFFELTDHGTGISGDYFKDAIFYFKKLQDRYKEEDK